MTTTATAPPTVQAKDLHALLPRIRERREEIESARQLPRDLVDELIATGIFSMGVPRVFGGGEASPADMLRVIELIAAADGSTGWCAGIGIMNNMTGGFMPEEGAREVFVDPSLPRALVADPAGMAREADGGVLISGRWRFASGVTHSDWITLGAIVMEGDGPRMTPHGPDIIHVQVPTSDIEIHDTVLIAALFCLYNRYVDGLATVTPSDPNFYKGLANRIVNHLSFDPVFRMRTRVRRQFSWEQIYAREISPLLE